MAEELRLDPSLIAFVQATRELIRAAERRTKQRWIDDKATFEQVEFIVSQLLDGFRPHATREEMRERQQRNQARLGYQAAMDFLAYDGFTKTDLNEVGRLIKKLRGTK